MGNFAILSERRLLHTSLNVQFLSTKILKLNNNHLPQWCVLCQCLHDIYLILCLNNLCPKVARIQSQFEKDYKTVKINHCLLVKKWYFRDEPKHN